MNRKEFKELLLEWNKKILNEKGSNIKFHKDQNQSGHYLNISFEDSVKIISWLKNYIEENNLVKIKDVVNVDYIEGGIVFPKMNSLLEGFAKYFEQNQNIEKSNEIKKIINSNDKEVVVISIAEGDDFNSGENQSKEEIYHWAIHDLDHSLYDFFTAFEFYICNDILQRKNFNNISNYSTIPSILNKPSLSNNFLKNEEKEELVSKFFKAIDFTPNVGSGDYHASLTSYCYIRMEDKNDVDEVNNLSEKLFTSEEKNFLIDLLKSSYEISFDLFSHLKEVFQDCIILIVQ